MIPLTPEQKIMIIAVLTFTILYFLFEMLTCSKSKTRQNLIKESNKWLQNKFQPPGTH